MLLIIVRLNYMSALYFSSISFAAHKKHGRVLVSPAAHRATKESPRFSWGAAYTNLEGLSCTLLAWARFPEEALAWCEPDLFVTDKNR
ncbi:MAG: hypothetical protein PUG01_06025, partial [Collinsella sp.]|nr:hypothetical protein [Collinsella sp.]